MELKKEFTIEELLNMAKNKKTPKKLFMISHDTKLFTKRLHWFESVRIFNHIDPYQNKIDFKCKICGKKLVAKFPRFENLTHHLWLDNHASFKKWNALEGNKNPELSNEMLDLIKLIVASYSSFVLLKRPQLLNVLKPNIADVITSYKTFRYQTFPKLYDTLIRHIEIKLNKASTICLACDIWTNSLMRDFIGVAAFITYELGHSEMMVIGMTEMKGIHYSESVKKAIELIINQYDFDNKKITGWYIQIYINLA